MKHIVLTGGTAGHVTPNIALIPRLRSWATRSPTSAPMRGSRRSSLKIWGSPTTEFPQESSAGI